MLRIATFNLENLDMGSSACVPLDARLKLLGPQIRRINADILCLQEINAQRPEGKSDKAEHRRLDALDALLKAAGLSDFHVCATRNRAASGFADIHNLAIVSRDPMIENHQLWHDLVAEPTHRFIEGQDRGKDIALNWDRPAQYGRIALDGGRVLHCFNLHLRAPLACPVPGEKQDAFVWNSVSAWAEGYYLSEIKRAGQALEVRRKVDQIFEGEPDALICIAGDFNAEEHHTPVEILRGDVDNTGNGALASRVMVPVEHSLPETRRFTVIHQGHRQMLDHIMVSRAMLGFYKGSEIHNEDLADELVGYGAVEASPVSYHAPVVAEFDL